VQLSENPLKKRMNEFLISENPLGFNKSQYQDDASNRLDKSIRYIYHLMKNQKNLRKDDVYEKINSLTLYPIIEYIFEDPNNPYQKLYNFRNVELARLLFQICVNYLKYSPLFIDDKYAQDDIDKTIQRFFTLSKSILEKNAFETLSEEREQKKESWYVLSKQAKSKLTSYENKKPKKHRRAQMMSPNFFYLDNFPFLVPDIERPWEDLDDNIEVDFRIVK